MPAPLTMAVGGFHIANRVGTEDDNTRVTGLNWKGSWSCRKGHNLRMKAQKQENTLRKYRTGSLRRVAE
ncbi:hypothetical protein SLA2020_278730 [Shorea laevis]